MRVAALQLTSFDIMNAQVFGDDVSRTQSNGNTAEYARSRAHAGQEGAFQRYDYNDAAQPAACNSARLCGSYMPVDDPAVESRVAVLCGTTCHHLALSILLPTLCPLQLPNLPALFLHLPPQSFVCHRAILFAFLLFFFPHSQSFFVRANDINIFSHAITLSNFLVCWQISWRSDRYFNVIDQFHWNWWSIQMDHFCIFHMHFSTTFHMCDFVEY